MCGLASFQPGGDVVFSYWLSNFRLSDLVETSVAGVRLVTGLTWHLEKGLHKRVMFVKLFFTDCFKLSQQSLARSVIIIPLLRELKSATKAKGSHGKPHNGRSVLKSWRTEFE